MTYRSVIRASWKDSDAYKKVYEIEKDIDKRAIGYIDNNSAYKNGDVVSFPSFWEEGRKKHNVLL